jgi:streptogramin lyase
VDVYTPGKAVDGDANTYWESAGNAFPQSLTADLGSTQAARRAVLKLPPASAWGARTQTLSVQGSTDGSSYSTVVASTGYRFDPATGNTVTVSLPSGTSLRYLRINVTGNTGWPAAQFSEVEAYLS